MLEDLGRNELNSLWISSAVTGSSLLNVKYQTIVSGKGQMRWQ